MEKELGPMEIFFPSLGFNLSIKFKSKLEWNETQIYPKIKKYSDPNFKSCF